MGEEVVALAVVLMILTAGFWMVLAATWIKGWVDKKSARRTTNEIVLAEASLRLLGILNHMASISRSLEKIATVTRVAAQEPAPLQTDKELEDSLTKARAWLDEASVGQPTKDLL